MENRPYASTILLHVQLAEPRVNINNIQLERVTIAGQEHLLGGQLLHVTKPVFVKVAIVNGVTSGTGRGMLVQKPRPLIRLPSLPFLLQ